MKITLMVAMIAAAGMSVQARDAAEKARPRVIVYVNNDAVQPRVLQVAESIAAGMFSGARVRMEWRGHEPDGAHLPAGAVAIRLAPQTPVHFMPGALAFARPYEGVHITVFCDRIQRVAPGSGSTAVILAHVLVHEITHILQGSEEHSDSGVMKATWTGTDYLEMTSQPLRFTPEDIDRIHRGLAWRAAPKP
jgi:hypothetical protein